MEAERTIACPFYVSLNNLQDSRKGFQIEEHFRPKNVDYLRKAGFEPILLVVAKKECS